MKRLLLLVVVLFGWLGADLLLEDSSAIRRQAVGKQLNAPSSAQLARRFERRRARLATPRAERARRQSRTKFAGLGRRQARAASSTAFAAELGDTVFDAARPMQDTQLIKPLSEHRALVRHTEGGGKAVLVSSAPIAVPDKTGALLPVNLALIRDDDSFAPARSTVPLRISNAAAGGVRVGNTFSMALDGPNASAAVVENERVWYPNAATDTDVIVAPVPEGAEQNLVLRSAASPERFDFKVTMPPGARLRDSADVDPKVKNLPRAIQIVRDGKVIGAIYPPFGYDADGTRVRADMSFDGDRVTLAVAHRRDDLRYPLYVDPTLTVPGSSNSNFTGWNPRNPTNRFYLGVNDNTSPGLSVWTYYNTGYNQNEYADWYFTAPPFTRIVSAEFFNHSHIPYASYAQVGLASPLWEGDNATFGSRYGNGGGGSGPLPGTGNSPFQSSEAFSGRITNFCYTAAGTTPTQNICKGEGPRPSVGPKPGSDGNQAIFRLLAFNWFASSWNNGPNNYSAVKMSNTVVSLTDVYSPGFTQAVTIDGATPTTGTQAWADDQGVTHSVSATVSDMGLGVGSVSTSGAATNGSVSYPCSDPVRQNCTQSRTASLNFSLSEGASAFKVNVADLVGNYDDRSYSYQIDRSAPTATLTSPPSQVSGPVDINGTATDNLSGPATWKLQHLAPGSSTWQDSCSPRTLSGGAGTRTATCTFTPTTLGTYKLRAVATDTLEATVATSRKPVHTGTSPEYTVQAVDTTPPVLTVTGGARQTLADDRTLNALASDKYGIQAIRVFVDAVSSDPADSTATVTKTDCPALADCLLSTTLSSLAAGPHRIIVKATDRNGLSTKDDWTVVVVAPATSAESSLLGLERFFAYERFDTGAGSQLLVNARSGNVVWHSVPIENPGRGLNSVINLTYNSQDARGYLAGLLGNVAGPLIGLTGADLADAYSQVGPGFSLGAGFTRVNEPLGGVTAAGLPIDTPAAVRYVDADGTRHTFAYQAGQGTYAEPAGVNLKLRRYSSAYDRRWAMTRPDGVTVFYDAEGYPTFVQDRQDTTSGAPANQLRFQYEWVSKLTGKAEDCPQTLTLPLTAAALEKLCAKRLRRIVDPAGVDAQPTLPAPEAENAAAEGRSLRFYYRQDAPLANLAIGNLADSVKQLLAAVGGKPGRIDRIVDHGGRVTRFEYDTSSGHLVKLFEGETANAAGTVTGTGERRSFELGYSGSDGNKVLASIKDPRGNSTGVSYYAGGSGPLDSGLKAASVTDRDAKQTTLTYPTASGGSYFFTATAPGSRITKYTVSNAGVPQSVTDGLGRQTQMTWDADNNTTELRRGYIESNLADTSKVATTAITYNRNGQQTSVTENGHTTTYGYCYGTELANAADCSDSGTSYVADRNRITRANGDWTAFEIQASTGNVKKQQVKDKAAASFDYDAQGNLTQRIDEVGNRTTWSSFDANGLAEVETDARGNTTATDPTGTSAGVWRRKYDGLGRLTVQADPRGTAATENSPFTTTRRYDNFDRLTYVATPRTTSDGASEWVVRRTSYDANDNATEATDGAGRVFKTGYDVMDRMARQETPLTAHASGTAAEVTTYGYDGRGNLLRIVLPKGTASTDVADDYTTEYTYDLADQLITQNRLAPGEANPSNITSYAYDRRGNRTGISDPKRNLTGSPAANAVPGSGKTRWEYTYDNADNQLTATEDAAGLALTTKTTYDVNERRETVLSPKGFAASAGDQAKWLKRYVYDAQDLVVREERGTGATKRITRYDRRDDGRVATMISPRGVDPSTGSATGFFQTAYTYNPNGDIAKITMPRRRAADPTYELRYSRRNPLGDPTEVTDPRGSTVNNTFFDSGELRWTSRPSVWDFEAHESGTDGPELTERPYSEWGDRDDARSKLPSTEFQGDFGEAQKQSAPGLLPVAGGTEFAYDADMRLDTVKDAAGDRTYIDRDPVGRVQTVGQPYDTFEEGEETVKRSILTSYAYDLHGNLVREDRGYYGVRNGSQWTPSGADGAETVDTYDQLDRLVSRVAPTPATTVGASPGTGTTTMAYDANGNVTTLTEPTPDQTKAAAPFTKWQRYYDAVDRRVSSISPDGANTTYGYDRNGNRTCTQRPRGTTSTQRTCTAGAASSTDWAYDEHDQPASKTERDASGLTSSWAYEYDRNGNRTKLTAPGARTSPGSSTNDSYITDFTYDGRDLLYSTSTPNGTSAKRTTVTEYDGNRNLRRTVKPRGVGTDGEPLWTMSNTDRNRHATVNIYDGDNLLTARELPWGARDANDQRRYTQSFGRDARGRVRYIEQPSRETTETIPNPDAWDCSNNCPHDEERPPDYITVTHRDRTTRVDFTRYDTGWVKTMTDQYWVDENAGYPTDQYKFEYKYDPRGNQTQWRVGTRTSEAYYYKSDQLRRREATNSANGEQRGYDYAYDQLGRLSQMRGPGTEKTWTVKRFADGLVSRVNENGAAGNKDTQFAYDADNNLTVRKTDGTSAGAGTDADPFVYSGGKTSTYEYDSLGRETKATIEQAGQTAADKRVWISTYAPSGQLASRTKPNGTEETFFRALDGRLDRMRRHRSSAAATTFAKDQSYTYDADGNRTGDERGTHAFNARGQLVSWTNKNNVTTNYELNGVGAITRKTSPAKTVQYSRKGDELTRVTEDGVSADVTHDAFGNVTSVKTGGLQTTYAYDAFGRVKSSTGLNGEQTAYSYDGLDRQDWKCTGGSADAACTNGKRIDAAYIGLSTKVSQEYDPTNKRRSYDYSAGLEPLGQDRFTVGTPGTHSARAFSLDANGSVEGLETADGTIANSTVDGQNDTYNYDPFGEQLDASSSYSDDAKNNPFRFQGFRYDTGTATYDMEARSYRPGVQEFLSPDHYESGASDEALMSGQLTNSRFMWAGANPVDNVEFDGHCAGGPGDGPCPTNGGKEPEWRTERRKEVNEQRRPPAPQPTSRPAATAAPTPAPGPVDLGQPEAKPGPVKQESRALRVAKSLTNPLEFINNNTINLKVKDAGCFFRPNSGCQTVSVFNDDPVEAVTAVGSFAVGGGVGAGLRKAATKLSQKYLAAQTVRREYVQAASAVRTRALDRVARGDDPAEAARDAVTQRNALKVAARAELPALARRYVEARNYLKYGNTVGPSYDDFIQAGTKTDLDIIESSGKTSARYNRFLGVK